MEPPGPVSATVLEEAAQYEAHAGMVCDRAPFAESQSGPIDCDACINFCTNAKETNNKDCRAVTYYPREQRCKLFLDPCVLKEGDTPTRTPSCFITRHLLPAGPRASPAAVAAAHAAARTAAALATAAVAAAARTAAALATALSVALAATVGLALAAAVGVALTAAATVAAALASPRRRRRRRRLSAATATGSSVCTRARGVRAAIVACSRLHARHRQQVRRQLNCACAERRQAVVLRLPAILRARCRR